MYRNALRQSAVLAARARQPCAARAAQSVRHASTSRSGRAGLSGAKIIGLSSAFAMSAGAVWYLYPGLANKDDGTAPTQTPGAADEAAGKRYSGLVLMQEEDSRNLQVEKSWENPGVYAWGSNAAKVVAPESSEQIIKTPKRIPYFDGKILRDLKLDQNFGVAVTEGGDIVQWGMGFSPTATEPIPTLTGKDITKVAISNDRIIALAKNGTVYSIPVSQKDQLGGEKADKESKSWIPFWSGSSSAINYRLLTPGNLGWGEKVIDVKSGLEHCLMLTSHGRVFSAASSTSGFPSKGQLGIPGLTWLTKPKGPFDQPHEIKGLPAVGVTQIAAGSYHSLALDKNSKVHAWGDNSSGQLGFEVDPSRPAVDAPTPVPLEKLYSSAAVPRPSVTSVTAGGSTSYFTTLVPSTTRQAPSADAWACGAGLCGALGTGKWTHVSTAPTKIKALSGLFEYDDVKKRMVPIPVKALSAGSTHVAAVMDNVTSLTGARGSNSNFGSDVVWWGGNECYQLGTGKRRNLSEPTHIAPLDGAGAGEGQRFQLTPASTVRIGEDGKGRKVRLEQRIECGRFVTAVYSATA